ncbi:hypothetical protein KY290_005124 [Solanum tuberosum]|uniref:Retrotransposon gag domain-containing protein n=1 Tax=Solanum tuberosum TaxID=4113 RepID=A0ABQ7WFP1_SOLTU|nr:hypothetical protein KY284_005238 [Solanum tuberosum]KAH0722470.1 hypothetical protein KY289_005514 [Solanum tuberosum]KAH0751858.1 hypothetical protein KY285_005006 [Solanum tuberosum]KAH0778697.1 hypothetical protein KY290_005124 [Solanum tuberosum]
MRWKLLRQLTPASKWDPFTPVESGFPSIHLMRWRPSTSVESRFLVAISVSHKLCAPIGNTGGLWYSSHGLMSAKSNSHNDKTNSERRITSRKYCTFNMLMIYVIVSNAYSLFFTLMSLMIMGIVWSPSGFYTPCYIKGVPLGRDKLGNQSTMFIMVLGCFKPPLDMTTTRANVRRNEEDNVDQQAPPQATNDPLEDKVSKVLDFVGVTSVEKAELAAYQLKGVAQVWFNLWKEARPVGMGPIEWERLRSGFIDRFFPLDMREALVLEFINLKQGSMSVKEYALRFTQLSKYAPSIVADSRSRVSKFVSGVSYLVVKACRTTMLIGDMDITCLMNYAQQIEEEKRKGRAMEKKRLRNDDGDSSNVRSDGHGRLRK